MTILCPALCPVVLKQPHPRHPNPHAENETRPGLTPCGTRRFLITSGRRSGWQISRSAGRCPGPPFEGMVERSDFRITEQPGDLLQCHTPIFEITKSKTVPYTVEDFAVGSALLSKVPLE